MARPHAEADLTRRIIVSVFELVAEHGVDGASMRRVAERTGLSTGTLNYHFESKEGLLHAALDFAYQVPADWSAHEHDATRALERLLRRYVLSEDRLRVWWRFWCAMTSHASKDEAVGERQKDNQARLVAFFAAVIERGVARGQLRRDLDPPSAAERLVALAHGLALRQLVDPRPALTRSAKRILAAEVAALA